MSKESNEALTLALTALVNQEHWKPFESFIKERRELWIADTRDPRVYQNHAELTNIMARVAECDALLELFDDARRRLNGEQAKPS